MGLTSIETQHRAALNRASRYLGIIFQYKFNSLKAMRPPNRWIIYQSLTRSND